MHARFLLGPAGSGKTYRCLEEIRERLSRSAEGAPLVLVAPNQTTYQLERQLLGGGGIRGYSRLLILSFERLAYQMYDWLGAPCPELLDEEGRVMVLRALLMRRHGELKLFHASARLAGFARQLSGVLREFQQCQATPEFLEGLAMEMSGQVSLASKLQDLSLLLREYRHWLQAHDLQDSDCLVSGITRLWLERGWGGRGVAPVIEGVWVDGFSGFTAEELDLLAALLPVCHRATITFCLDESSGDETTWLSSWSVSRRAFEACRKRLTEVEGVVLSQEDLGRDSLRSRYSGSPVLAHLEKHWAAPQPASEKIPASIVRSSLRVAVCADPSVEVALAAREILDHVRRGGRYRDVTLLVRNLESYHHEVQRRFSRYDIPFFLDRRESMAHHPVAELTRSALRVVALGWQHEDWFAALKTGLIAVGDDDIDRLENEALARGWRGKTWQEPLKIKERGRSEEEEQHLRRLESQLEALRQRIVAPFQKLAMGLRLADNRPTGRHLAGVLRDFWRTLNLGEQADSAVEETVWTQMNSWVDNLELAFAEEAVALRDWLPILEAGLGNLTVGLIPPVLDQVLVGPVDRSRNPDSVLVLVLGLNEGVFPPAPGSGGLLSETDRAALEKHRVLPASTARQQLSRERYYAYIACTRARQRLVLTAAQCDGDGKALNPSPFIAHVGRLFQQLEIEDAAPMAAWQECRHPSELVESLPAQDDDESRPGMLQASLALFRDCGVPGLNSIAEALEQLQAADVLAAPQALTPATAGRLYGPVLRTSVSRMEQFAACPFKFFVHSGLRAKERKQFELDSREQGSFQHDVLAMFHENLRRESKRWRDITPSEARERVGRIGKALAASYREGLLESTEQTRFMARLLTESLQDFVEVLVGWMRGQYRFDPAAVELPFGPDEAASAWSLDLGDGKRLELYGRIDRVDLFRDEDTDQALCVVVDYKSGQKQLDPLLVANGLQLQLLAYLNVLRRWPNPAHVFGPRRIVPAGVFYVNLRGWTAVERTRSSAFAEAEQAGRVAYRHSGRFDASVLRQLDSRTGVSQGDQFNYRLNKDGSINKNCREPVPAAELIRMLDKVEASMRDMGAQVYQGVAEVRPFRRGVFTACEQCDYRSICRIDPWTHQFRRLKKDEVQPGSALSM